MASEKEYKRLKNEIKQSTKYDLKNFTDYTNLADPIIDLNEIIKTYSKILTKNTVKNIYNFAKNCKATFPVLPDAAKTAFENIEQRYNEVFNISKENDNNLADIKLSNFILKLLDDSFDKELEESKPLMKKGVNPGSERALNLDKFYNIISQLRKELKAYQAELRGKNQYTEEIINLKLAAKYFNKMSQMESILEERDLYENALRLLLKILGFSNFASPQWSHPKTPYDYFLKFVIAVDKAVEDKNLAPVIEFLSKDIKDNRFVSPYYYVPSLIALYKTYKIKENSPERFAGNFDEIFNKLKECIEKDKISIYASLITKTDIAIINERLFCISKNLAFSKKISDEKFDRMLDHDRNYFLGLSALHQFLTIKISKEINLSFLHELEYVPAEVFLQNPGNAFLCYQKMYDFLLHGFNGIEVYTNYIVKIFKLSWESLENPVTPQLKNEICLAFLSFVMEGPLKYVKYENKFPQILGLFQENLLDKNGKFFFIEKYIKFYLSVIEYMSNQDQKNKMKKIHQILENIKPLTKVQKNEEFKYLIAHGLPLLMDYVAAKSHSSFSFNKKDPLDSFENFFSEEAAQIKAQEDEIMKKKEEAKREKQKIEGNPLLTDFFNKLTDAQKEKFHPQFSTIKLEKHDAFLAFISFLQEGPSSITKDQLLALTLIFKEKLLSLRNSEISKWEIYVDLYLSIIDYFLQRKMLSPLDKITSIKKIIRNIEDYLKYPPSQSPLATLRKQGMDKLLAFVLEEYSLKFDGNRDSDVFKAFAELFEKEKKSLESENINSANITRPEQIINPGRLPGIAINLNNTTTTNPTTPTTSITTHTDPTIGNKL